MAYGDRMYDVIPIGHVRSSLVDRAAAPMQGNEGAPDARLVFDPQYRDAVRDLRAGDEILVLTWLHQSDRSVRRVHPRDDLSAPIRGVFSTRSPDRPNPIGIHRVRILAVETPIEFTVAELEAIDGTPIIDVKPVLDRARER
jgi:tRNA-Thr(GGU) m(6)t(6)A37 methyltransferase TsaA